MMEGYDARQRSYVWRNATTKLRTNVTYFKCTLGWDAPASEVFTLWKALGDGIVAY